VIPGARLVMLGRQGAGKGTQCVRLSRHYVVPHISTGDMLRSAVREGTEFGGKAKEYMDAGDLLPDDIMIGVVQERLDRDDTSNRGFVLDGFPRTVTQAKALRAIMQPLVLDLVIDLDVPTDMVLRRLASRRMCVDCQTNYSADSAPRYGWVCDNCGGEVVQRADDTEASIKRRLDLYEKETEPLIDHYRAQGLLIDIDGVGSADEVTARLVRAIHGRRQTV
jgi:adenylate kinase